MPQPPEARPGQFLLRLVLFLPPCFALWYWLAGYLLFPAALLSDWTLLLTMPHVFADLTMDGRSIVFDTLLTVSTPDGRTGFPTFPVDPLIYAYNLPVLYALLLAGPTRKRLVSRLALGYLLLLPAWVWGISFRFAKIVTFDLGPEVSAQVGAPGLWLEAVALAYQFGYLILPVFTLVIAWYLLARADLAALTGATAFAAPPPAEEKPRPTAGRRKKSKRPSRRAKRR